jgi:hypothetical protein
VTGLYRGEAERLPGREGDRAGGLVHFGKIHAISVLQTGDLLGVELHFQIGRHDRNMDRLALRGVGAFGANAVKFQIPVMGLHEFIDDCVHGIFIVLGVSKTANRSKTLEHSFVSISLVTLPAHVTFLDHTKIVRSCHDIFCEKNHMRKTAGFADNRQGLPKISAEKQKNLST